MTGSHHQFLLEPESILQALARTRADLRMKGVGYGDDPQRNVL
jgi:hypothetical protein